MTRLAGPIRQIGVIVHDAEAAIRHWAENLGVGPFVVFRKMSFDADYRYRGRPAEPPVVTIAIGHSGPLQIEIIEQHNFAPSGYRDFLAKGMEGMQHVSPWCSSREEFDATYRRLLDDGLEVIHEGRPQGSDIRFAYFNRPGAGWPQIEISEALLPASQPLTDALERLHNSWDGKQTIIESSEIPRLLDPANSF